jgi:hypothetical protein
MCTRNDHHQRGQPVDQEAYFHPQAVAYGPGIKAVVLGGAPVPVQVLEHDHRQHERQADAEDRYPVRSGAAYLLAKQARDDSGKERRQDDSQVYGMHEQLLNPSSNPAPGH